MKWRPHCRVFALLIFAFGAAAAQAADCPGNPGALGTSRVMTIDPQEFARIGTIQYARSLPLQDKEVVLTFDDGPMPPYTNRVLDVLAEQCVKANYFIIGRMARGYPQIIRRIMTEGHVIGTHSQNHPLAFERMPINLVQREIEDGIASVGAALGDRKAPAPFFRIPGLLRAPQVESYLQSRGLVTWSADAVADDWKHISAAEVVRRAMARLDEKGKGILLLHDIQPATALALPELLRELKAKGYRIVQVAPGQRGAPTPPPAPVAVKAVPVAPEAAAANAAVPVAETAAAPIPESAVAARLPRQDTVDDSLTSSRPIPRKPVRPFTPEMKPAQNVTSPGKLTSAEPGGWPPSVSVPLPGAGGVGVSSIVRTSQTPDGRFQQER